MIGSRKTISSGSHDSVPAPRFSGWLAGAALAIALAMTPQFAHARDQDGDARHGNGHRGGGSHADGRSFAGRSQAFNANAGADRGRDFGHREAGGRGFGGRDFERRNFEGRRTDVRQYAGRRFDGDRRSYSRPYYGRGYGGWRGSRWWGSTTFIGFGSFYDDSMAWPYYGLAAWELAEYADLTERQVRAQEDAMIAATSAPLNDPIAWNDGESAGSVTPLRDGQTTDGRTCREFQQEIVVDGKRQRAFGTACREPDGSWQMVEK